MEASGILFLFVARAFYAERRDNAGIHLAGECKDISAIRSACARTQNVFIFNLLFLPAIRPESIAGIPKVVGRRSLADEELK